MAVNTNRLKGRFRCTFSGLVGLAACAMLVGCPAQLSHLDEIRINERFDTMYELAQIPRPPPKILYRIGDPNFNVAAITDCRNWSITLSYSQAARYTQQIIDLVIPHEYAHLASCYYRGSTDGGDGDPHDEWWQQWVIRLGGDPNYI